MPPPSSLKGIDEVESDCADTGAPHTPEEHDASRDEQTRCGLRDCHHIECNREAPDVDARDVANLHGVDGHRDRVSGEADRAQIGEIRCRYMDSDDLCGLA